MLGNVTETAKKIKPSIFGIALLRQYIDYLFRSKVKPIKGSVVYTRLTSNETHSGIYIGDHQIANIVVDPVTESFVDSSTPQAFTQCNQQNKLIYVGCNAQGVVGDLEVAHHAINQIGERNFYGLIFKNSHDFTEKCLYHTQDQSEKETIATFQTLQLASAKKLGITKWKLWDWQHESKADHHDEPNLKDLLNFWQKLPLNQNNIEKIKHEINACSNYLSEIEDENLPKKPMQLLLDYKNGLQNIQDKYQEVNQHVRIAHWDYSYHELMNMGNDFLALLKEMESNQNITNIVKKLGQNYISEEKKLRPKVIKRMNNEVLGIHKSNDLMRMLPSELSNLESDLLEVLFYSKIIENSLLTYELITKEYDQTSNQQEEYIQATHKNKGPIIACLDTSGSMFGAPILKAKALLLAITKMIEKENRSLYVILFGSTGQTKELNLNTKQEMTKIIHFLEDGFGGGTDFETPFKKGIQIIKNHQDYNKADILMITDGLCDLNDHFIKQLNADKKSLNFSIYTIICAGNKHQDRFSDEIIVI